MQKETVNKDSVLCARCVNREHCRGIDGPLFTGINKCDEFKRDWSVKKL